MAVIAYYREDQKEAHAKRSGVMSFDVAVHRFLVTQSDFYERC